MQFFIILLLLGSRVMLTRSRPTRLVEGHDSETAEVEYEGNDDTAADDYNREDQDSTMEEAQQKSERHDEVLREPQEPGESRDFEAASDQQAVQDKYRYETISENNSGSRKERQHHGSPDLNSENGKDYPFEKQRPRNSLQIDEAGNIAPNEFYSRPNINQMKRPQSDLSVNGRSVNTNPEYGEMLFKIKPAQTSRQQSNLAEEADEQSRAIKQYNNMHSKNREQENENTYNYYRDRRHAQNGEENPITDSTRTPNEKEDINIINDSSENAIIKNIKKLSEQDLEELLNSLPDDKRALLKKIMDKREITKKAGAVDESYLEGGRADTSKLEGGYSIYCNTESAMTSDTPETNRQPESSESLSTKIPDNESGSRGGGSGSKTEIINNTEMNNVEQDIQKAVESTDSKNNVNIHFDAKEISKNENKREINSKDLSNEKISSEDSKIQDYQLEAKDSDDIAVNQEDLCSENEDWPNEPEDSNARVDTYKREISPKEPSALQDSVKSLKDSFPAANSYDDNTLETEMAPLIRMKRTEKEHQIKKRDLSHLPNAKVHFSPEVDSEDCENEEKSEFEDYGVVGRASNNLRNDQDFKSNKGTVLGDSDTQCRFSQFNKRNSALNPAILSESQKTNLGSDTDSVLSGIEGVDYNNMYNNGLRGKRTPESVDANADKINLQRSGRTTGPMNVDVVSDNSVNVSQYQEDEAFGPLAMNSEEDVSRFKRVRQVKNDSQK